MKIFLPFKQLPNPYLDEIIKHSEDVFIYDHYLNYNILYDFVNIHWPEAIFDWTEPTLQELATLEQNIIKWKKNSVLIYTKHDYKRNKGTTLNFTRLFEIIEKQTDIFIHLGDYSKKYYLKKYPLAKHKVIYHPLFENSLKSYSKIAARNLLGIDQKALVVIAPGKIRTLKERKMVLKSFEALKIKNKVLISTNMRSEIRLDFPGRVRFKRFFDVQSCFVRRFKNKYQPPEYCFNYEPMPNYELSLRMSAADVVLVPRIDILNSGIVFLGLTFGKVTVGPAIGNIEEQLTELNYPVFNPLSISSVTEALEKGIKSNIKQHQLKNLLNKYFPENVARDYHLLFQNSVND